MLKYKVVQRKNPINQSTKFYAQLAPVVPMLLDELCDNISTQTTMTSHDVKAVISALEQQVYRHLRNGRSVRLGDFGSFHPTLSSTGANAEKFFTTALIKQVRVRYCKSARMIQETSLQHPAVKFMDITPPDAAAATTPETVVP